MVPNNLHIGVAGDMSEVLGGRGHLRKAGLHAARARGRLGGRPKAKTLDTAKKVEMAQSMYENENNTIEEICSTLHVSRATLYRYIRAKDASEENASS